MAIDFSQVKTITIPEGSVKKITDSAGVVLWKENLVGWHTVFEGNFSKTINSNSGRPTINICDLVDCDAPLKLRITGSINITDPSFSGTFEWIGESEERFNRITNPLIINKEITVTDSGIPASSLLVILDFKSERSNYMYVEEEILFSLYIDSDSKTLKFNVYQNRLDSSALTLNITKVEQYY